MGARLAPPRRFHIDLRAAAQAVFLPPPLRFLLAGPTPPPGSFGSAEAHAAEAGPTPFGMGRMLFAGSPDTVAERIRASEAATGVGLVDLVFSSGQIPPTDVRRSIELFGREVLPRIRDVGPPGNATSEVAAAGDSLTDAVAGASPPILRA